MKDAFKCGHPRTDENTRWNGTSAGCRACYRVWLKECRQRTNRAEYERQRQQRPEQREATRLRRLRKLLTEATAAKPHLYQP